MKKVFIKTYGCAHNQADSEFMAGQLANFDFKIVDKKQDADVVIINTCTVKDPSEKKFFSELSVIKKPVVVAGCIPQADKKNSVLKNYSLVGVKQIDNIVEVVNQTLDGNIVHLLNNENNPALNLPRVRRNPVIEIIPISNGCLGYCTFCKTRFARGKLASFSEDEIIKRVRIALNDGVKEIWLTSEDTGAYGLDIKTTLPNLLRKILQIPKDFKVRLGMINPEYVKKYSKELIEIFNDSRIYKFLHVPVQSANNRILKLMKRSYTIEDFQLAVNKIKKGVLGITIATDIICGFPTETDIEFEDTLKLVREFRFPVLNISKFYPRSNTSAAKMKLLNTKIVKARSKKLSNTFKELFKPGKWIGWKGLVLINEYGKNNTFIGRNDFYKPIIIAKNKKLFLGQSVNAIVEEELRDYLKAKIAK